MADRQGNIPQKLTLLGLYHTSCILLSCMPMRYLKIIGPVVIIMVLVGLFFLIKKPHDQVVPSEASMASVKNIGTTPDPTGKPSDISKIPILTYHSFGPKPEKKEGVMQLHYRITAEKFDAQMKYLADQGYKTITFTDLIENQINGKPIPEQAIVLTFDDGWKSQYDFAVPILEKYKFTGTFFIVTGSTGAKAYMSADELKDLNSKGFEIAAHTKTHPKLVTLDDTKLADELQGSKKVLEDKLGITITTMAYPYYGHDDRVMKAVQAAGYLGARAGWAKFNNDMTHLFNLKFQKSVNNPYVYPIIRDPFHPTDV